MSVEFKLPELGENVQAGEVINVLVNIGDTIKVDQPILELETDKATVEVPSSVSGVVQAIHIQAGHSVKVGQLILTLADAANEAPIAPPPPVTPPMPPEPVKVVEPASPPEPAPMPSAPPMAEPRLAEFRIPELGENIQAGTVVNVLVKAGESITADQAVLEIETDKATVEIPSAIGGLVKAVHLKPGDTVQVNQLVLTLETAGDLPQVTPPPPPAAPATPPTAEVEPPTSAVTPSPSVQFELSDETALLPQQLPSGLVAILEFKVEPDPIRSMVPAAPNVRRLAREIGVDITQVPPSGPAGRVSMADVKQFARQRYVAGYSGPSRETVKTIPLPDFSKWGQVTRQPMSNIRRKTAEHLSQAWATIPHVTQFAQADIGEVEELRQRFAKNVEAAGAKLTITAILLKVVTSALKAFPHFNASVDMAKSEVVYKQYYHLGVAVDTEHGLLVPVIRDVDKKNILELSVELQQVAEKARSRKLSLEEMQGGNFTITNLGGIGGSFFTPIVNAPEVAILGVARGQMTPVYNPKTAQFEPRLMLPLALSYDHRLIDGADGARFLKTVVEHLEQPFLTALQGW